MRLDRLTNLQDYQAVTEERTGQSVITGVSFEDGCAESVRVNLQVPNCSYRRASSGNELFPHNGPLPFDIGNPSLMLSLKQLSQWQNNFATVHDAMGDTPLGSIRTDDPVHQAILPELQARSFEIAHIDTLLENLPVETALYTQYNDHHQAIALYEDDELTADGITLLDNFNEAFSVYAQLPELRSYSVQTKTRRGNLGPRGQRFREWLNQNHGLPVDIDVPLTYIGYELKPWHMSGRDFRWNQADGDLRLASVDLLCHYQNQPVWCEVKMNGDTLTSSAVLQVLFYGSCVCNSRQRQRLDRIFPNQFENTRPWLAVIVEKRDHANFIPDFEQAVGFARHPATQTVLEPHFDGMIFIIIRPSDDGWAVTRTEKVRW